MAGAVRAFIGAVMPGVAASVGAVAWDGMAGTAADLATLESAAPDVRSSAARLAGPARVGLQVAAGPVEAGPAADAPEAVAAATVTTKQINGPGAGAPGPFAARPLLLALTFDPARST